MSCDKMKFRDYTRKGKNLLVAGNRSGSSNFNQWTNISNRYEPINNTKLERRIAIQQNDTKTGSEYNRCKQSFMSKCNL